MSHREIGTIRHKRGSSVFHDRSFRHQYNILELLRQNLVFPYSRDKAALRRVLSTYSRGSTAAPIASYLRIPVARPQRHRRGSYQTYNL